MSFSHNPRKMSFSPCELILHKLWQPKTFWGSILLQVQSGFSIQNFSCRPCSTVWSVWFLFFTRVQCFKPLFGFHTCSVCYKFLCCFYVLISLRQFSTPVNNKLFFSNLFYPAAIQKYMTNTGCTKWHFFYVSSNCNCFFFAFSFLYHAFKVFTFCKRFFTPFFLTKQYSNIFIHWQELTECNALSRDHMSGANM